MNRFARFLCACAVVLLSGCPGRLDDPEKFAALPACRGNVDVERLFAAKCGSSLCHGGQSTMPAAGLDLTSPGVASRLVDVPSMKCDGMLRIDRAHPDQSFLLGKITQPPAGCGDRMPLVGILTQDEVACIRAWILETAAAPLPDGGTSADASTDASVDPDASTDAGSDGSVGPDASTDAGSDGSVDPDASTDASVGPDASTDGSVEGGP